MHGDDKRSIILCLWCRISKQLGRRVSPVPYCSCPAGCYHCLTLKVPSLIDFGNKSTVLWCSKPASVQAQQVAQCVAESEEMVSSIIWPAQANFRLSSSCRSRHTVFIDDLKQPIHNAAIISSTALASWYWCRRDHWGCLSDCSRLPLLDAIW